MFKNLDAALNGHSALEIDSNEALTEKELMIGSMIFLLKIAAADNQVSGEEITEIVRTLNREFEKTDEEAGHIIEVAQVLKNNPSNLNKLAEQINQHATNDQKLKICSLIWKVILADGQVKAIETAAASSIRNFLGLSLEQATAARAIAEQQLELRTKN